jgi:hypothetical protein
MSVASIGLDQSQSVGSTSVRSSIHQAHQDFDQLYQALQSGNLSAAKQAYSSFQQIQAGLATPSTAPATNATANTATNPVAADWSALGQTLQSGSLSSAQDALSKLGQDAQAAWQTHLQQETQNARSVYALMQSAQGTTATSAVTSTSTQPATNSVQNDLNALNQSLQSGDTTAAQKLLTQLVQDLQASNPSSGEGHHHHHHHGGFSATNAASAYGSTSMAASTSSTSTGTMATTSSSVVAAA